MRSRTSFVFSAVFVSIALGGCGDDDGSARRGSADERKVDALDAAADRSRQAGCQAQRRAETYRTVGLRDVTPPGETATRLQAAVEDTLPAGTSRAAQAQAGLAVLSLGDDDSTGERGETLDPKDREDVAVSFRPLVPGGSPQAVRGVLEANVRETSTALRQLEARPAVESSIRGNVARITAIYGTGRREVRERTAVALTSCSLVAATGWPDHVDRVMRVAANAGP
jgi:hypothetical protein